MGSRNKEGNQGSTITEQHEALIRGLGARNPQYICAAAYLCSRLDEDFPGYHYEWDGSNGVTSEAVTWGLAFMGWNARSTPYEDKDEYRDIVEKGTILAEYSDNLPELSLHLYLKNNEAPDESLTWNRAYQELEAKRDELERDLDELEQRLNT